MEVSVAFLVLLSAAGGAGVHAVIAKGQDRFAMRALISVLGGVCFLPALFFVGSPGPEAWLFLAVAVPVHVSYNQILIRAYDFGDFSAVFPLARGMAPLAVALAAVVFLGEYLTLFQVLGVFAICAGVLLLTGMTPGRRLRQGAMDRRAILLAGLAALHIAAYTLLDGLGVRAAPHPFSYITYFFVCEGTAMGLLFVIFRRRRLAAVWRQNRHGAICGGIGTGLAFGAALWALGQMPIALVSALRETNGLFAALIGVLLFREAMGRQRLIAAAVICFGVIVINLPLDLFAR